MNENKTNVTLTYAGRRESVAGKLVHVYYHEGEKHVFNKSLYPASAGTQLTIDATPDLATVWPSSAKYAGRTEGDQVAQWAAEEKAAVGAAEGRKMAKAVDPFKAQLAPLKDAMWNMGAPQRAAFISAVVRELMS